MSSHHHSKTLPSAFESADTFPADTRMLAQQQVRLLGGMVRLLSRLLCSLLWEEMHPREQKKVLAWIAKLEYDLHSVRRRTTTRPRQTWEAGEDTNEFFLS